jgi:hypothetical protein
MGGQTYFGLIVHGDTWDWQVREVVAGRVGDQAVAGAQRRRDGLRREAPRDRALRGLRRRGRPRGHVDVGWHELAAAHARHHPGDRGLLPDRRVRPGPREIVLPRGTDTWVWNGTNWILRATSGPSSRQGIRARLRLLGPARRPRAGQVRHGHVRERALGLERVGPGPARAGARCRPRAGPCAMVQDEARNLPRAVRRRRTARRSCATRGSSTAATWLQRPSTRVPPGNWQSIHYDPGAAGSCCAAMRRRAPRDVGGWTASIGACVRRARRRRRGSARPGPTTARAAGSSGTAAVTDPGLVSHDDTWELVDPCEHDRSGHATGGPALACKRPPRLGGQLCFSFPSPQASGYLLVAPGLARCHPWRSARRRSAPRRPSIRCGRGIGFRVGGNPAQLCLPVPWVQALPTRRGRAGVRAAAGTLHPRDRRRRGALAAGLRAMGRRTASETETPVVGLALPWGTARSLPPRMAGSSNCTTVILPEAALCRSHRSRRLRTESVAAASAGEACLAHVHLPHAFPAAIPRPPTSLPVAGSARGGLASAANARRAAFRSPCTPGDDPRCHRRGGQSACGFA